MKLAKTLIASAVAAAAISSVAQADVSTNIAVSSDYVWRGVTQTGYGAAVSGGIDYEDESGFYAGTWVSNTSSSTSEVDLYLGFGGDAGEIGYSVYYLYYAYPSADADAQLDFGEIGLDLSYDIFSAGFAVTVNTDVDADESTFVEGDVHYYAGVSFDLGDDWSLGGTLGFYDFDADGEEGVGDVSYTYFQIDLGKSYGDWGDFGLSLSSASEEAETFSGNDEANEPLVWVSWSKGF